MLHRFTATPSAVISLVCAIGLLPSVTAWAGTLEAPELVWANPDGTFSYEAIYTPGAYEAFNYSSSEPGPNTIATQVNADGFCQFLLAEGVSFLVPDGEPISGRLIDPTAPGTVTVSVGTCFPVTPTPTATPVPSPAPLGAPISEASVIIEGYDLSIKTTILPFGSLPCTNGTGCAPGNFCETPPRACDEIGVCKPLPETCPPVSEPVCGCDGNTYGSACEAAQAGVSQDFFGGRCALPTPTATPTATPTPTPTPEPTCSDRWPVTQVCTLGKGQSPSNNAKVSHCITGNIVNPGDVGTTAQRIAVCSGTSVNAVVSGSAANTAGGNLSCDATGCRGVVSATEKYKSVSADGKDTDRMTLIPSQ